MEPYNYIMPKLRKQQDVGMLLQPMIMSNCFKS